MSTKVSLDPEDQHTYISWQQSNKRGKVATGLLVIIFGVLYLLKAIGVPLEPWVISWQTIVIGIGIVVLIRHKFKKPFSYILILIGVLFLLHEWYPKSINVDIILPIIVIIGGIGIMFKSRRNHRDREHRFKRHWKKDHPFFQMTEDLDNISKDDFIDAVSIFGGVQKNVVSKQFRGADIVTIFGGNEINLSQADFTDRVVMDVTILFGGTTLVIPSNWQIKSEIVSIFGSIEDKRPVTAVNPDIPEKVFILRGTCLFGGIEVNSFNS